MRMLCRIGNSDRFRLVLGSIGKSAELGKAHDQPSATEDRWRHGQTEIFVRPFGGQDGEVLDGDVHRMLVLAAVVVRLLETALRDHAKPQVPDALGYLDAA